MFQSGSHCLNCTCLLCVILTDNNQVSSPRMNRLKGEMKECLNKESQLGTLQKLYMAFAGVRIFCRTLMVLIFMMREGRMYCHFKELDLESFERRQ